MKKLIMVCFVGIVACGLAGMGAAGKRRRDAAAAETPPVDVKVVPKVAPAGGVADIAAVNTAGEGKYRAKFISYQGDSTDGAILLLDSVELPGQKRGQIVTMPVDLAKNYDARFTRWNDTHPFVTVGLKPNVNGGAMIVTLLDQSF